ncbi:hypothetical protein BH09SUM1_BH09SUM1_08780 [soil metagenome]
MKSYFLAVLLLISASRAGCEKTKYYLGDNISFPATMQAKLDTHADIISLGINPEWLRKAQIDPDAYISAIDKTATAVVEGRIPGAVIYADRLQQTTMPIAVGSMMTDPQKRPTSAEMIYDIHDLTGALLTVPLALSAIDEGKLTRKTTLGELFPKLKAPQAAITIEDLLNHRSGFVEAEDLFGKAKTPDEIWQRIRDAKLKGKPGDRIIVSDVNYFLLARAIEKVQGEPFSTTVQRDIFAFLGMGSALLGDVGDRRQLIAPGRYSNSLRRMVWAEQEGALAGAFGAEAGHAGAYCSADDLSGEARALLALAALNPSTETTTSTLALALLPRGGEPVSMGFRHGRFGARSFGWDSPAGSSFWVLPEAMGFIIFLSNADHPNGNRKPGDPDVRDEALPLLARSLGWKGDGVDTGPQGADSSSPPRMSP